MASAGRRRPIARAGLAALVALQIGMPGAAVGCALELILAVDVSGSIDNDEWRLQSEGMATAFEDPAVADAIAALDEGLLVTYTQWSGTSRQRQVTGWHHLTNGAEARAFAARIRGADRGWRNFSTAVGEALRHARAVSATAPERCDRRVIDVAGDGVSNEGVPPLGVSRALAAEGYQVNALVIRGASPDPVAHFRERVIVGPRAFVEIAEGFADYPRAIRRKLLRELDQNMLVSAAPEGEDRGGGRQISGVSGPCRPPRSAYIRDVLSGTMAINAHVISGPDPGAVPGGSTKSPSGRMGPNQDRRTCKGVAFAR